MSSEYTSDATGSDQTLQCRDCGQDFVFTAGEQAFYASRGFTHPPTRCPDCRAARKAQERGGSYGGGGGGQSRAPREMFTAICANCGREAQVPFQPRDDRPVYCSDCYQPRASTGGGGGGRSSGGRSNDRGGGGRRERW